MSQLRRSSWFVVPNDFVKERLMGNRGRRGRNDWHQRAAEFHDLAAHAHRVAATHRAKKITRPDANFRNKRWNTQPRLTSTHEMLIRNREILSAKHEIRRAP